MNKMIKAGIIGATGITGYELTKLLMKHPEVEISLLNSTSSAGKKVKEVYPDFEDGDGTHDGTSEGNALTYQHLTPEQMNQLNLDVIFLCTPHKTSMEFVPLLKNKKTKIIDVSADYRFKNHEIYKQVYKTEHKDKETKAVYGLPELFREKIKKAKVIGNPGCYATSCILSSFPVQKLASHIIFDCKSGFSGAGKNSIYMKDREVIRENIHAYNLVKHRHKYEVEQFIKTKLSFTPHVIDAYQGIMCTAHILLKKSAAKDLTNEKVKEMFRLFYKGEDNQKNCFIEILDTIPSIKDIKGTNKCLIGGFEIDENNQLVVVAVIDNLIKGAVGQAVQNMNIMFGLDETVGLI